MKRLTWKEVLASGKHTVMVESYGYTEKSVIFSHFEPFKSKRSLMFKIHRFSDGTGYLEHPWLILNENEEDLTFYVNKEGLIVLDDPDLFARPSND